MAEDSNDALETGAEMDYQSHEQTFSLFMKGTQYLVLTVAAVLIAMAAGLMGGAGFFGSLVLFVILMAAGAYFIR